MKATTLREAAVEYMGTTRPEEMPVQRLLAYGAGALSTEELLACVLGRNAAGYADAKMLLDRFDGLVGLAGARVEELLALDGIGPSRVAHIKAALELGRRLLVTMPHERPAIRMPSDAANLLMAEMRLLEQEELRVILLDTRNRVIDVVTVYKGNVWSAIVRPAEVFRDAIRRNASKIMLAHNHPSGDPTPSSEDYETTKTVAEVGKLMEIEVVDHIIIGGQRFVSFRDRGLMGRLTDVV